MLFGLLMIATLLQLKFSSSTVGLFSLHELLPSPSIRFGTGSLTRPRRDRLMVSACRTYEG